jgi:hypothetical protein
MVMVEEKVGLPEAGLKLMVTPAGCPEAESETDCEVPLTKVAVTVAVVELPCWTVPLEGLTLREKSKGGGVLVMVRV